MKNTFSNRTLFLISLMLFSMFFGAGNLIFPPMVGKLAGTEMPYAMLFFGITAVLLPVLGMMAVAKTRGLPNLGLRVGKEFATPFTILVYMSIGPFLAIPRAGSVPFEMAIAPYLPAQFSKPLALLLYTAVFFILAGIVSLMRNKTMNKVMGDILTPALLIMLFALYIGTLFADMPPYGQPLGEYAVHPSAKGFIDGYLTMDTLAALNFGLVISLAIESYGINDKKSILHINIKISMLAGCILFLIYMMLADIGAKTASLFPDTTNGAQILVFVSDRLFGKFGAVILALIFTLACLTTCIGLIASISHYFTTLVPRLSYTVWVIIWTIISFLFANIGLDGILKYNIPILTAIYPVSIMLIILALSAKIIGTGRILYRSTIYVTAIISIVNALDQAKLIIPGFTPLIRKLPFYTAGLGWLIPAFTVLGASALIEKCINGRGHTV
ncbi:branched-chain amino acid transport system II carrier protein [Treponema sp. OMZ 840]|uniref:branched-chain amino acid transport system II carrier protein n=1 Tax=Treponema sp. OMZ 840 TaxID=244313 RepID=UPI003D91E205